MAAAIWSGSIRTGSYTTEAASVARLTSASSTPSSLASTFSTRRTQDAQVMPPMSSVHDSVSGVAISVVAVGIVVIGAPCAGWCGGGAEGRRRTPSRPERVAGLVDGGGDVGPVDLGAGRDGDGAGRQVD